jgi:D-aminoacyl-tRNA deacylase
MLNASCFALPVSSLTVRAVVQRVASASVSVDGEVVGRCGRGLLLLVAAHRKDEARDATRLAEKIANLRIFNDGEGKMNLSLGDLDSQPEPEVLAVSNFTVYGDTAKNRRPSFIESAPYERGQELFDAFVESLRGQGVACDTGVFGANMQVALVNDGPVTVIVEAGPSGEGSP